MTCSIRDLKKFEIAACLGTSLLAAGCSNGEKSADPAGTPFTDAELEAQGCALDGISASYESGEGASSPSAKSARLVPCFRLLGLGSAEGTIAAAKAGTITYAPVFTAEGNGLVQSHDHGRTWDVLIPEFPGGRHGRAQPYLYMDPATERMFFATTTAVFGGGERTWSATSGFNLTWSADSGATWNYVNVASGTSDWAKIYSGPPVSSSTLGYPSILYLSAPSPISIGGTHQAVYKSLDGGSTWEKVGGEQLSLRVADYPDCDPNGWVIYGNGVVGPDGTVYVSLHRCGHFNVAISSDEGNTWQLSDVPGTTLPAYDSRSIGLIISTPNMLITEPLAIDTDGNLYAVWPDDSKLLKLSVSRDKGLSWSKPLVVSEPSVQSVVYAGVAAQKPGTIAIAYFGSEDGSKFDGYMAETTNALSARPVFQSARVNDPAAPLFPDGYDVGYGRLFSGGDLHEIVKVIYAENGDIWATFAKDMCIGLGSETDKCGWDMAAHVNSHFQGALGRLVHR